MKIESKGNQYAAGWIGPLLKIQLFKAQVTNSQPARHKFVKKKLLIQRQWVFEGDRASRHVLRHSD